MKLETKLKLIKVLDDLRWSEDNLEAWQFETSFFSDSDLFNISDKPTEKQAEAILLTHYLTYICDRQMPYRHIFKAGGYVISRIVEEYLNLDIKEKNDIDKLFERHFHPETVEQKHKQNDIDKSKYKYYLYVEITKNVSKKNKKIFEYFKLKDLLKDKKLYFTSRFMLQDIRCMYKTFLGLYDIKSSFKQFLRDNSNDGINGLAENLYNLTYNSVSQISGSDNLIDIKSVLKPLKDNLNNFNSKRYESKRLWCVIRDFFYHPVFKDCFIKIIGKEKFEAMRQNISDIELPGDVWNNNPKFIECFWDEVLNNSSINSSKFLREKYNEKESEFYNSNCYPINFDITFNFVPKMCADDKCELCPLYKDNSCEQFEQTFCHKSKNKLCTFVLYSTGVRYKCPNIEQCKILNAIKDNS